MKKKLNELEKEIKKIKSRNTKVEAEKAWETSFERKLLIVFITYVIISIVMFLLWFKDPLINALIPTFWYLLSTLSISFLRKKYIEKYVREETKDKK